MRRTSCDRFFGTTSTALPDCTTASPSTPSTATTPSSVHSRLSLRVDRDGLPACLVARGVVGQHLGQRLPRPEIAPAAIEHHGREIVEPLHHRGVDRHRRNRRVDRVEARGIGGRRADRVGDRRLEAPQTIEQERRRGRRRSPRSTDGGRPRRTRPRWRRRASRGSGPPDGERRARRRPRSVVRPRDIRIRSPPNAVARRARSRCGAPPPPSPPPRAWRGTSLRPPSSDRSGARRRRRIAWRAASWPRSIRSPARCSAPPARAGPARARAPAAPGAPPRRAPAWCRPRRRPAIPAAPAGRRSGAAGCGRRPAEGAAWGAGAATPARSASRYHPRG